MLPIGAAAMLAQGPGWRLCRCIAGMHGPRARARHGPRARARHGPRARARHGPRARARHGPRARARHGPRAKGKAWTQGEGKAWTQGKGQGVDRLWPMWAYTLAYGLCPRLCPYGLPLLSIDVIRGQSETLRAV